MLHIHPITKTVRKPAPCHCKAYPFPHREGSGKCLANEDGPFCGECGQPCTVRMADNGIGSYEFWGRTGFDRRIEPESKCCSAPVYSNHALTINYESED